MKYKKSLYLLAAALLVTGCSEQEVPVYGEDAIVNDIYGEGQSLASVRFLAVSLNYDELELGGSNYDVASKTYLDTWSFSLDPMAEDYVLEVPLALMGTVVDKARQGAGSIETTMESTDGEGNPITIETAPEGSYEVLEAVIPANEKYGYIRIKLNNAPELAEDTYEMNIKIDNSPDQGPQRVHHGPHLMGQQDSGSAREQLPPVLQHAHQGTCQLHCYPGNGLQPQCAEGYCVGTWMERLGRL